VCSGDGATKLENFEAAGDYQEEYAYWNALANPPGTWLGDNTELEEYVPSSL
jgi:hypothetical protein